MKRFWFIGVILILALSSCDNLVDKLMDDDDDIRDGYDRRGVKTTTVAGLKDLRDDTNVKLTGEITGNLSHEMYEFDDGTGTVEVEIERKVWRRGGFDRDNLAYPVKAEIIGEMDKERGGWLEIDVDTITKQEAK